MNDDGLDDENDDVLGNSIVAKKRTTICFKNLWQFIFRDSQSFRWKKKFSFSGNS